ncbi:hypothetical protein [Candidatus Poriferisodalis sp.]|uniref:hypothetical protein n=1 Tax=Candidatus Poriferisodalis sp. TaxID=3101277 RepID=UPI003B51DB56
MKHTVNRRCYTKASTLARALTHFDIHPLDEPATVGRRLADSETSDIVGAHLAAVATSRGRFVLT